MHLSVGFFYLLSLLVLSYEIFQICKILRKYWTNSLEFEMDIKKIAKRVRENTWNLSSFRLCVITHDMMFWLLCALRLLYVCFFYSSLLALTQIHKTEREKKESVTAMMASGIRLFRLHINHICMQIRKEIQMTMAFILIDNFRKCVQSMCVHCAYSPQKKLKREFCSTS